MSINLSKGQRINLEKNGSALKRVEIGVNWGAIQKTKKALFGGIKTKTVDVDLDASVGLLNDQGQAVDIVYFGQLKSKCGSISHSGDDLTGDIGGDDGQDNEVISIDLERVPPQIKSLALILNSFRMQDFADIPFANIRIHDGNGSVFGTFDIANDASFAGKVSMIMASVYRHDGAWKFRSIGEAVSARDLRETLIQFAQSYA